MRIYEMGDGTLVQLDKKDIASLRHSIIELEISSGIGCAFYVRAWLLPFLKYLLAETGEVEDKDLLTPNKIAKGLKI